VTACDEIECLLAYKSACSNGQPCDRPWLELEDAIALGERPCFELLERLAVERSVPAAPQETAALQVKRFTRAMREQNISIRTLALEIDVSRGTLTKFFRTRDPKIKGRCYASVAARLGVPLFSIQYVAEPESDSIKTAGSATSAPNTPEMQPEPDSIETDRSTTSMPNTPGGPLEPDKIEADLSTTSASNTPEVQPEPDSTEADWSTTSTPNVQPTAKSESSPVPVDEVPDRTREASSSPLPTDHSTSEPVPTPRNKPTDDWVHKQDSTPHVDPPAEKPYHHGYSNSAEDERPKAPPSEGYPKEQPSTHQGKIPPDEPTLENGATTSNSESQAQKPQSERSRHFQIGSENRRLKRDLSAAELLQDKLRHQIKQVEKDAKRDKIAVATGAIGGGLLSSAILNEYGDTQKSAMINGSVALACLLSGRYLASTHPAAGTALQTTALSIAVVDCGTRLINLARNWHHARQNTVESSKPDESAAAPIVVKAEVIQEPADEVKNIDSRLSRSATQGELVPTSTHVLQEPWPGVVHPGIDESPLAIFPYMPAGWYCETDFLEPLFARSGWDGIEFVGWVSYLNYGAPDLFASCELDGLRSLLGLPQPPTVY